MSNCVTAITAAKSEVKVPIDHHDRHAALGGRVEREEAGDQVDAGDDHRRGVDQRGDRRRPLHRVREPDVQREHRALAGRARVDQHRREGERAHAHERHALEAGDGRRVAEVGEVQAAGVAREDQQAEQEAEVGEARDDEGLLAGRDRARLLPVVADEQEGGDADQLPEDVDLEDRDREHEPEHRAGEEVQGREVARVARLAVQVAGGVDVHEQADAGDDHAPAASRGRRR